MSHQPVHSPNLPKPVGPYSPGMGFEKLIFVSGQGGTDPLTGTIADSVEQQTEQCLKNVQTILEAAGSGLQHVLRCGVFLMDMGEFKNDERRLRAHVRRSSSGAHDRAGRRASRRGPARGN